MSRRRFIADEVESNRAALTGAHAAHLSRVLRARVGQEYDIALGNQVRRGTITRVADARVEFELGEFVEAQPETAITLALAVFKFDRFEWAVEKCTELRVSRIVPVVARRTDAHLAKGAVKRAERWRRIAREASEQSRRLSVPEIADPLKLREYLSLEKSSNKILLAENEGDIQLRDLCENAAGTALAIGPEGGWSPEELKLFADFNWQPASLGKTILRAETAAMAALAIVRAFSL
jgi:16S rRNA (uracil1498-N3)-methyltransferase